MCLREVYIECYHVRPRNYKRSRNFSEQTFFIPSPEPQVHPPRGALDKSFFSLFSFPLFSLFPNSLSLSLPPSLSPSLPLSLSLSLSLSPSLSLSLLEAKCFHFERLDVSSLRGFQTCAVIIRNGLTLIKIELFPPSLASWKTAVLCF